jgi:hypothetical protein
MEYWPLQGIKHQASSLYTVAVPTELYSLINHYVRGIKCKDANWYCRLIFRRSSVQISAGTLTDMNEVSMVFLSSCKKILG